MQLRKSRLETVVISLICIIVSNFFGMHHDSDRRVHESADSRDFGRYLGRQIVIDITTKGGISGATVDFFVSQNVRVDSKRILRLSDNFDGSGCLGRILLNWNVVEITPKSGQIRFLNILGCVILRANLICL